MQTRDIYLNTLVVDDPQEDYVYHIRNQAAPNGEVILTFKNIISKFNHINLKTLTYQTASFQVKPLFLLDRDVLFIAKRNIPRNTLTTKIPPLLLYSTNTPNQLQAVSSLQIYFSSNANGYFENIKYTPYKDVEIAGEIIKNLCQQSLKNIPVDMGKYPLFLDHKRPSYALIEIIYNQFLNYNNDDRLNKQFKDTDVACAARAHFVSTCFHHYGITTYKLFKTYKLKDWETVFPFLNTIPTNGYYVWAYHCATMIIDNENRQWVWDPWIGLNRRLLTINEWANYKPEPTPKKLIVNHAAILLDISGKDASGDYLKTDTEFYAKFQIMCTSAIPSPPEPPLYNKEERQLAKFRRGMQKNSLFAAKVVNPEQDNKKSSLQEKLDDVHSIHPKYKYKN